ncbi:MAG: hypothetical protein ABJC89_21810 [Acidobacteriota bacterium]
MVIVTAASAAPTGAFFVAFTFFATLGFAALAFALGCGRLLFFAFDMGRPLDVQSEEM